MSIVDKSGLAYYDKKSQARNGYWESQEDVKAGDVRLLAGKDGTAFVLECIVAGKTDDIQPKVPDEYIESEYAVSYADYLDCKTRADECLTTANEALAKASEYMSLVESVVNNIPTLTNDEIDTLVGES